MDSGDASEYCADRPCDGVGGERVDELKVDPYVPEPVDDRDERWVYRSELVSERAPL